jgi:hypothetical protein
MAKDYDKIREEILTQEKIMKDDLVNIEKQSLELDQLIERWLWDQTQIDVDFEIHDALGKLARLGLTEVDSQGRWTPIPLANASLSLDENWEKIFRRRPLVPTV